MRLLLIADPPRCSRNPAPPAQMKPLGFFLATASILGALPAPAQITVELADLQMTSGVHRSFLTHQGNVTVVNGLILGTGGPFQWDFSAGVGDETYHYEILPADQSPFSGPFAGATLTELRTVDSDGRAGWTFFNLTPDGRELHGFHDPLGNPTDPVTQFNNPVVDYPATIDYLDSWSVPTSYSASIDIGDLVVPVNVDVIITSFVDGYGTLTLPTLGTVDVLRINELSLFDSVADVVGTPVPLGQSFVRSYLWISKEYGLVAQIASEGSTLAPPAEFDVAARYLRLSRFTPAPTPLRPIIRSINHDEEGAAVTIICAGVEGQNYILEVSDNLKDWQSQGDPVIATGATVTFLDNLILFPSAERYYRVHRLSSD